ncbi:MAG: hypothetical protein KIC76_02290 [Firmicutes bacterium]|nr:hypothetical protein [Bacillota bacterium]
MKNKYIFFKRLYKDYVIIFEIKGKYKSLNIDNELIKYINNGDLSYVIVKRDFNVLVNIVSNNEYYKYLLKFWIKQLIYKKM